MIRQESNRKKQSTRKKSVGLPKDIGLATPGKLIALAEKVRQTIEKEPVMPGDNEEEAASRKED